MRLEEIARSELGAMPEPDPLAAALRRIGHAAIAALYDELALDPKPGLVSFVDNGSHDDMDTRTFMRSLFALRHGFHRLAALGAAGARFGALEQEGIEAEARMLRATAGVNTHRGAIFSLGLLCASAGAVAAEGEPLCAAALRRALVARWGTALDRRATRPATSNGSTAALRLGLRGAGAEAALGFPLLFEVTLPAMQAGLRRGASARCARVDALFHTIAVLDDTNLAHRGGLAGLRWAQRVACDFLLAGGMARPDGLDHARRIHREFVRRRLSPGGAADLLAAACWAQRVCAPTA